VDISDDRRSRKYGGNVGYDDDPATIYRYDSDVANHLQVRQGDVVIIRSRAKVIGIATIEQISEGLALKESTRFPNKVDWPDWWSVPTEDGRNVRKR
jgi:hypothetical protein